MAESGPFIWSILRGLNVRYWEKRTFGPCHLLHEKPRFSQRPTGLRGMLKDFLRTHIDQEIIEVELAELIETARLAGLIDGEAQRLAFIWMYTQPPIFH